MGKKVSLGKTSTSDRVEFTWTQTMSRNVAQLGLSGFKPKAPDMSKIKPLMDKGKTPLEWFYSYDASKGVFSMSVSVGSSSFELGSFDLSSEKDLVKRRKLLEDLRKTDAVTSGDLAEFDKKHPPPPDPAKLKALKDEIERLKSEIDRDKGFIKNWPTKFATMDPGLAEIGFTNWAKGHRYDRYVTFLLWTDWGRDKKSIYEEFIKTGAPQIVKLTPAAKKQADDSMAAKAPKFDLAVKEVGKVVDTILIPLYRKEDGKAVENRMAENQKTLAKKAAELKALVGR
jgi:hypothetical protein